MIAALAALVVLVAALAAALWRVTVLQRRTSYRLSMARGVAAQVRRGREAAQRQAAEAIERAGDAEARLESARQTMLTIAEATAAGLAARPGPVLCVPRAPVSIPAPCVGCSRELIRDAVVEGNTLPVLTIVDGHIGWVQPFTLRWGDA